MAALKANTKVLVSGGKINAENARLSMLEIMNGEASDVVVAGYLTALKMCQDSDPEIVAACADVMLELATKCPHGHPTSTPQPTIDIVGTGGDGLDTFNVSTCAGLVMAACGVTVTKHGNRSSSGNFGSADFLEALGANIMLEAADVGKVIEGCGYGFLFSQKFHPAMKNVSAIRKQLGIPTVFNILGPLTNPAEPQFQLLGVSSVKLGDLYAALTQLRGKTATIVHGNPGIDEISIESTTQVWEVTTTEIKKYEIHPSDFGLEPHALATVIGGNPTERIASFKKVLDGGRGPIRDFIVLNAAAGLKVAGIATTWSQAATLVINALESGKAKTQVEHYVQLTQRLSSSSLSSSLSLSLPSQPHAFANFATMGKKIVCVGKNYRAHIAELAVTGLWEDEKPKVPVIFLKPTTSYSLNGQPLVFPTGVGEIQHELELGVVINTTCKHISETDAMSVVAGYVLGIDVTARDLQLAAKHNGMPWTVSKGYDDFCPVSDFIPASNIQDPQALEMWLKINGSERQSGTTANMIWSVPQLIAYVSTIMTLEPGELILTGTPEGVGPLLPGDKVSAGITGHTTMEFEILAEST